MCSLNHNMVLATSSPFGSIRSLDHDGIIWLLENHISPSLMKFNPISMSVIPGGRVIFADGDIHQVSTRKKKENWIHELSKSLSNIGMRFFRPTEPNLIANLWKIF